MQKLTQMLHSRTKKCGSKKGFTLVELIIVIAIIAILAAVLLPTLLGQLGNANKSSDIQTATSLKKIAQSYVMNVTTTRGTAADGTINSASITGGAGGDEAGANSAAVKDLKGIPGTWTATYTVADGGVDVLTYSAATGSTTVINADGSNAYTPAP